ncbi:MAG TPA: rhodanese-like domain-containing protein [Acidimicrobiales bacterium]
MPIRITREDLYARIAGSDPLVIVEALGGAFYADAHLPGAINIPPSQVERLAPALIPDRTADIVVYCSETCASSDAVARRLELLGYTSIAVYGGGKEDWVENGLPLERA